MSETAPIHLSGDLAELINNALASGNTILVAAVDASAKPLLSFRGSVAVFAEDTLSFWARNGEGGTVSAIRANPNVALMYRSPTVPLLQFTGRARVAEPGPDADRAYAIAPEYERDADAGKKGVAVIVEIDAVFGVLVKDGAREFVKMARG